MSASLAISERRRRQRRLTTGLILIGATAAGCAPPTIRPNSALIPRPLPTAFRDDDWAAVLRRHVRNGLVDYDTLARERDPLDRYYALISAMGPNTAPDQFPSANHRLAYDLNAYNVCMLCLVLQDTSRATLYDISTPDPATGVVFRLDGANVTLRQLEQRALETSRNDVRVLFALSRGAMGGPGLRAEPYRADALERQLADQAAASLDNPFLLKIDHAQHAVFVWIDILSRRDAFFTYWQQQRRARAPSLVTVLIDLASDRQRQALTAAVGYAVKPIPFDRKLNRAVAAAAR